MDSTQVAPKRVFYLETEEPGELTLYQAMLENKHEELLVKAFDFLDTLVLQETCSQPHADLQ
jgi:hypothetical protein